MHNKSNQQVVAGQRYLWHRRSDTRDMSSAERKTDVQRDTGIDRNAHDVAMLRGAFEEARKVFAVARHDPSAHTAGRAQAAVDTGRPRPRRVLDVEGDPRYAVARAPASAHTTLTSVRASSKHVAVSAEGDDDGDREQPSSTPVFDGDAGEKHHGDDKAQGEDAVKTRGAVKSRPLPAPAAAAEAPSTRLEDAWRPDRFTVMGDFEACPHSIRARDLLLKLVRPLVVLHVPMHARNDPQESDAAQAWQALYGGSHSDFTSVPRVGVPLSLAPHWLPADELERLPRDRALFIGGADDLERFVQVTAQTPAVPKRSV